MKSVSRWLPPLAFVVLPILGALAVYVIATVVTFEKRRSMDFGLSVSTTMQLAFDLADFWWSFGWLITPVLVATGVFCAWLWWSSSRRSTVPN